MYLALTNTTTVTMDAPSVFNGMYVFCELGKFYLFTVFVNKIVRIIK